jgi:hypothetical protein
VSLETLRYAAFGTVDDRTVTRIDTRAPPTPKSIKDR